MKQFYHFKHQTSQAYFNRKITLKGYCYKEPSFKEQSCSIFKLETLVLLGAIQKLYGSPGDARLEIGVVGGRPQITLPFCGKILDKFVDFTLKEKNVDNAVKEKWFTCSYCCSHSSGK